MLGEITVVEQKCYSVGCYASDDFREIFVKNYFEGGEGSGQYLCSAHWNGAMLFMSFSGGAFIIQPLPAYLFARTK